MLTRGDGGGLEPDFLLRVVLMGDEGDDIVTPLQQKGQAVVAHLAVTEEKDAGGHGGRSQEPEFRRGEVGSGGWRSGRSSWLVAP